MGFYASFDPTVQADYQSGLIEQLSGGIWSATATALPNGPDSGLVNLNSVSCSDANDCVGVGEVAEFMGTGPDEDYGLIYTLAAGAWTMQTAPVPSGVANTNVSQVGGVSCPNPSACVAVGDYSSEPGGAGTSYVMTLTLSSGIWTAHTAPVPSNVVYGSIPSVSLNSIDCPEVGACQAGGFFSSSAAGDTEPLLLQLSSGTWTASQGPVPSDLLHGIILGIACPAVGECYATGWGNGASGSPPSGVIWTDSNGTWSAADAPLPPGAPTAGLPSLATPRVSLTAPSVSSTPAVATSGGSTLAGVSCATDGFCAAAGTDKNRGLIESATVLGITPAVLPKATAGAAYAKILSAIGGTAPYTWSLSSGTLPAGLTLSSAGVISGTPTAAGTSKFSVEVTDSNSPANNGTKNETLSVG